jgi:hypothetical protein
VTKGVLCLSLFQNMKPLKVTQPLPVLFEELANAVHVNALALVGIDKEEKNEKHLLMAVRGEAIPTPSLRFFFFFFLSYFQYLHRHC